MSVEFKPFKDEWIGYIICKEKLVVAEIGKYDEVFKKISDQYNELLQRYEV